MGELTEILAETDQKLKNLIRDRGDCLDPDFYIVAPQWLWIEYIYTQLPRLIKTKIKLVLRCLYYRGDQWQRK